MFFAAGTLSQKHQSTTYIKAIRYFFFPKNVCFAPLLYCHKFPPSSEPLPLFPGFKNQKRWFYFRSFFMAFKVSTMVTFLRLPKIYYKIVALISIEVCVQTNSDLHMSCLICARLLLKWPAMLHIMHHLSVYLATKRTKRKCIAQYWSSNGKGQRGLQKIGCITFGSPYLQNFFSLHDETGRGSIKY